MTYHGGTIMHDGPEVAQHLVELDDVYDDLPHSAMSEADWDRELVAAVADFLRATSF